MFIGHYGVAMALKRAEPRTSLVTLTVGVLFLDILWLIFVAAGWEQVNIVPGFTAASPLEFVSYPLSHSLVATVIWSVLVGTAYYSWPTRDTARHRQRALVLMLAVFSHWPLDLIVHVRDLPIAGDESLKLGLGLWNSIPATVVVELLTLWGGAIFLMRGHSNQLRPNRVRLALLAGLLTLLGLVNLVSPPPPSVHVMVLVSLLATPILLLLVRWADRPRAAP
jgi:hypothetical protein